MLVVVGAALVGGGLVLEVVPTALEKVAGGFVMDEVDLGPGVVLRGATDTDRGLLCWQALFVVSWSLTFCKKLA